MAELRIDGNELVLHLSGTEKVERLFAAVHHNTPSGLPVRLNGTAYDEWIVGCADPEAVAAGLGLPAGA